MSRSIITKSGSEFITSISSEKMLGELCQELGCKFYKDQWSPFPSLAYSMTKEESLLTAQKLKQLVGNIDSFYPRYKKYLAEYVTEEDFKIIILRYVKCFEESAGYDCIS